MAEIYLDHAATSPLVPDAMEAMLPLMRDNFGNPSSVHGFGRRAAEAIDAARRSIARDLGCRPNELVFTSGGTESDNLALIGTAEAYRGRKTHIVTSQIEHHAVLHACRELERRGFSVTYIPVDEQGRVDPGHVEAALSDDTFLVSVMFGNNEVGTLQPIAEIGRLTRAKGILLHTDAVQALGCAPIDLARLPVDLASFSAHKIGGPKGIGALYAAPTVRLQPLLHGGLQERSRRAGTENTAAIAGFAAAMELAVRNREANAARYEEMRRAMLDVWTSELGADGFRVHGDPVRRLPHILNVAFPGVPRDTLLMNLDLAGIAVSSGSACTAGSVEPSHVLEAMGLPEDARASAVRFSFGYGSRLEFVTIAARETATVVQRLRSKK